MIDLSVFGGGGWGAPEEDEVDDEGSWLEGDVAGGVDDARVDDAGAAVADEVCRVPDGEDTVVAVEEAVLSVRLVLEDDFAVRAKLFFTPSAFPAFALDGKDVTYGGRSFFLSVDSKTVVA